jgi:hypothetical protein
MQSKLSFKRITAAEAQTERAHIAVRFSSSLPPPSSHPATADGPPPPSTRPVGRPPLKRQLLHTDETEAIETAAAARKKSRGTYTTWFSSPYINDILAAYRRSAFRSRVAVAELRRYAPDDRYERLSHSTIAGWFDQDNQLLPHLSAQLEVEQHVKHAGGRVRLLEGHPEVEQEMKDVLVKMREAGAPMGIKIVRWVMKAIMDQYHVTPLLET